MNPLPLNINEKFSLFHDYFSPKIIAQMNDYHFKLGRFKGDFIWHSHPDTDEVFIVFGGEMRLDFRDGPVVLKEGEMLVVPKGVEHKPFAEEECRIMMIERSETMNTGDAGGARTKEAEWI